ncbi:MAG: anhydro-N-acetylmuramic acid kinase [Phycisphaeraceae bacterium]|nr:anhydro-N-acetylmuramic acid kinase [Phycisphaeraceae bacterium]
MRTVLGAMTGTSLDGLDLAAVRIRGAGLSMECEVVGMESAPLGELGGPLRALASGVSMPARDIARIALEFGELHAAAALRLAEHAQGCDLLCAHGQTIVHNPPISWQLLNPWPIARALRCPVVSDLRGADLASGGQGAPLTPIADRVLFREAGRDLVIVNLGGYCNCTLLRAGAPSDALAGFDVCACNQVIDASARAGLGAPYDGGGTAALNGSIDDKALGELTEALAAHANNPRSLGTGDEAHHWVERWRTRLIGDDLCATAVAGVAETIAEALTRLELRDGGAIALAGGGVHNSALVKVIRRLSKHEVITTSALGVEPEAREAACFAVLGALCADGVPISLPGVTGGEAGVLSGSWVNRP